MKTSKIRLSERERHVLWLIAKEFTTSEIAEHLKEQMECGNWDQ